MIYCSKNIFLTKEYYTLQKDRQRIIILRITHYVELLYSGVSATEPVLSMQKVRPQYGFMQIF
jgi:hypothetical protein